MNKASAVVVPSGYLKAVFQEYSIIADVIPNIINLERFTPGERRATASSTGAHLIITRNLEPIYGITTAIHAISILRESFPDIRLSVAGSGPQKGDLMALVDQLGLGENVIFTGKIGPDEIASMYRSADIMLNPTTVDNMPNSVLESLACGVPVVTTNVGGVPFIVEDGKTALLVDQGDSEGMAEKVCSLLENPELYARLVKNGLAEVKQYSWSEVGDCWISLYKKLELSPKSR
ncbi:MAG: glycosyltransferase family 4 protein [Gammaproteobacteria bacterium]|nr:glycosyltransferase family 4 protein [Gammaproteobacteria bacterium]